jgi:hypothetical protein
MIIFVFGSERVEEREVGVYEFLTAATMHMTVPACDAV